MCLSDFLKDINSLYYKTGLKSIERLSIRTAQSQDSEIQKWLKSNPNIKNELSIPEVYDALILLGKIRDKFPSSIKSSELFTYLMSKPSSSLPVIMTFPELLQNESASDLLFPYRDIIMLTTHLSGETKNPKEILSDLQTIRKAIVSGIKSVPSTKTKKRTKQQKKIDMFSYLIKNFSDEIASAADRSGMDELANVIRGGALAKPSLLEKYVPIDIDPFMQQQAHNMVKHVLTRLGDVNFVSNYNIVKERALNFSNLVNPEELLELYNKREEQINIKDLMEPDTADESVLMEDIVSLSPSDATLLNPDLLSILSAFFAVFYHYLR